MIPHILWKGTELVLLDQRELPQREKYLLCKDVTQVAEAIVEMAVRGAPVIGIVAALGVVLEARKAQRENPSAIRQKVLASIETLASTRPTARNLFWALERMKKKMESAEDEALMEALEEEALKIWQEDVEANKAIGRFGAELISPGTALLTHCNAGALATGGYGTALGIIRRAWEEGKVKRVFATETRPLLQGARLTAWELSQEGIPVTLVVDGAVGYLMAKGLVEAVVVGADRITSRGDVANKIGTYTLAVLAKRHGIPFFVAAPLSTFDLSLEEGNSIPIEERDPSEVLAFRDQRTAPERVEALNPAFDVTPAELISAIVTEKGILWPPLEESIKGILQ